MNANPRHAEHDPEQKRDLHLDQKRLEHGQGGQLDAAKRVQDQGEQPVHEQEPQKRREQQPEHRPRQPHPQLVEMFEEGHLPILDRHRYSVSRASCERVTRR